MKIVVKIIHIINFKYPTKEFLSLIETANLPQICPKYTFFQVFCHLSLLVFLFSTSNGFICDVSKINCAMFGVLIFLVLCLNVIGYMCGGNGSWGE